MSLHSDKILDVAYYSQYRDIGNTTNAHRACGMTCIKMVLEYCKKQTPELDELVDRYITDTVAYGPYGWKHDFFVDFLKSYGLNAYRKEKMDEREDISLIQKSIQEGKLVIVSVEQKLFDKKLFHMILIVGVRENGKGELEGFFYNDPGRLTELSGYKQYVSLDEFKNYWRKMAIFTN